MRTTGWCAVLGGLVTACASDPVSPAALSAHAVLQYRATTRIGASLLTGSLEITVHEDSSVTGSWVIDWVPGADRSTPVGPQVGSGTFTGGRCGDYWCLNLNQNNDNNVYLLAKSFDSGLSGTWSWSTIAGPTAGGYSPRGTAPERVARWSASRSDEWLLPMIAVTPIVAP